MKENNPSKRMLVRRKSDDVNFRLVLDYKMKDKILLIATDDPKKRVQVNKSEFNKKYEFLGFDD